MVQSQSAHTAQPSSPKQVVLAKALQSIHQTSLIVEDPGELHAEQSPAVRRLIGSELKRARLQQAVGQWLLTAMVAVTIVAIAQSDGRTIFDLLLPIFSFLLGCRLKR